VQYDHLGTTPIHLDLMRVHVNEVVTVQVGIELRGVPRGVSDGGALEQLIDELEIKCLVAQIPEVLHANVSDLGVGDSILVSDLEMPEGVTPVLTTDARVATVRLLAEEVEAKAEGEEGEVAQPEVIGRARKEEGEEAGGGT
jgi:large subunit ribosomal protein L25